MTTPKGTRYDEKLESRCDSLRAAAEDLAGALETCSNALSDTAIEVDATGVHVVSMPLTYRERIAHIVKSCRAALARWQEIGGQS
jgi:hypothetical protein